MIFYSDFYPFAKFRIESFSSEMKYFPSQLLWGRIKDVICGVFLRNRSATLKCHASNKDFVDICLFLNHSLNIFAKYQNKRYLNKKFGGKIWKLSDLKFIISDCKLELEAWMNIFVEAMVLIVKAIFVVQFTSAYLVLYIDHNLSNIWF
jgi:hypothetical protein